MEMSEEMSQNSVPDACFCLYHFSGLKTCENVSNEQFASAHLLYKMLRCSLCFCASLELKLSRERCRTESHLPWISLDLPDGVMSIARQDMENIIVGNNNREMMG